MLGVFMGILALHTNFIKELLVEKEKVSAERDRLATERLEGLKREIVRWSEKEFFANCMAMGGEPDFNAGACILNDRARKIPFMKPFEP